MLSEALRLIPYALVAAMSPTVFAATLAVIASGRLKALGFAVGLITGQVLTVAVLLRIGSAAIPHHEAGYPTLQAVLEIALALGLVWLAARLRRRPPTAEEGQSERTRKALDRLDRMHIGTAAAVGLLLGVGTKRLVLSALAAGSIAASAVADGKTAALVGWYALLATVTVWLPVLAFVLFGKRAAAWLATGEEWLVRYQRQAIFYLLVVLAVVLAVDGVATLL